MLRHYKGLLGEFNYHDDVFRVETKYCKDVLCYIGNDKAVSLPKGCTNTRYMFCRKVGITQDIFFSLVHKDTTVEVYLL